MSTFVITVPGTFITDKAAGAHAVLERRLSSRHTSVSEGEGLQLLTVNEDRTFSARIEVDAADRYEAEMEAVQFLSATLKEAGVPEGEAPLGPPAVTGIDSPL
ncbi:hypothetical protein ACIPSE_38765 [Streptomyces sp. NPDC090106]|uniref:hypothetical protein n=1 Tax=Streptomyces sp. NPDC090106 TaxID=3365946 RepID=UPI00381FDCE8